MPNLENSIYQLIKAYEYSSFGTMRLSCIFCLDINLIIFLLTELYISNIIQDLSFKENFSKISSAISCVLLKQTGYILFLATDLVNIDIPNFIDEIRRNFLYVPFIRKLNYV